MSIDVGDVAGVLTGLKAGEISEREARRLLREYGTGDSTIDGLISTAVGIGVGIAVGSVVDDIFDGIFGGD